MPEFSVPHRWRISAENAVRNYGQRDSEDTRRDRPARRQGSTRSVATARGGRRSGTWRGVEPCNSRIAAIPFRMKSLAPAVCISTSNGRRLWTDTMARGNYVAYYRVSTKGQGVSGLGLDAQREAVHRYLNGGDWQLLAEYSEIESGGHDDRPQLAAAMQRCKLTGATLVIARLDRLSRNVAFLAALMDSGVEFVAVDNPHATRFTLHILSAVAEHERLMIASRTKAALAAAKARGVALGGRRGTHVVDHRLGAEARQRQSQDFAQGVGAIIRPLRDQGMSLREIAAQLTVDHVQTLRGGAWTATAVANVLRRIDVVAEP